MIDLRSDTGTQPSAEMLAAMAAAETGDDVYGEDPTVNALEAYAAEITGKEAALYAASGTQTNLLGILSHCERGHEYIVGSRAHTYMYEGGGAAVLGSIQPCPIPFNSRGELPLDEVEAAVKPDDAHFAITRLVCLENTHAGKVLSMAYLDEYSRRVQALGLRRHLDGARAFNAAVKLDVTIEGICQYFDSASLCLSKGLAAPVGSVLVGSKDIIARARRYRKMLGGGMRQAGVIAAAGLYALRNNVQRLADDHANAARMGQALKEMGLPLANPVETNIVMLAPEIDTTPLIEHLQQHGVRINGHRWVFHRDISSDQTDHIIAACRSYRNEHAGE